MGRLMSGLNPLEISERRVSSAFGGQSVPGPFPFETLGSVWPAMGVGPRPKVPTLSKNWVFFLSNTSHPVPRTEDFLPP